MKTPSRISSRLEPAVLLLAACAAFGLLIPWLGFYWDDWAKILVARLFGLGRYVAYYAGDRPLSAWTHVVFTPILGTGPRAWLVFELILRWLSAWGFWACLRALWPSARRQNFAAALIFLVYPVFIQQPAAVTFFQQWLQYALFFFSLFAMLAAQRVLVEGGRGRSVSVRSVSVRSASVRSASVRFWTWTVLALLAMLLHLSVTEYFVPVELIRPILLWIWLVNHRQPDPRTGAEHLAPGTPAQNGRKRLAYVLKAWAPYLLVLVTFTVWRLFFLRLPVDDPYRAKTLYDFLQNPAGTLVHLFQVMLVDGGRILFGSWVDLLHIQVVGAPPFELLSYAVGALVGGVVIYLLLRLPDTGADPCWLRQALALGAAAALLGPVPAWITGRQVVFDFHSDRYALPAMFGASLLWVCAVEWLVQARLQKTLLFGALIALAVGLQLRAANDYRWIWTDQQRMYWELSWRAPGIQAPTVLLFQNEPFPNQGLFSTSAAINLMYPQPQTAATDSRTGERLLGYWVYTLLPRYQDVPDSLEIGFSSQFRTLKFTGKTPDSLLLYNDPRFANCVWVLSPRDASYPYLTKQEHAFVSVSNLDRIVPQGTPGYPPTDLIGAEPEHTWCYYFEKADLTRQLEDWDAVVRLGDAAQAQGYRPGRSGSDAPYEWLPFVEGYAHAGQPDRAAELTRALLEQDSKYGPMLCELWERVKPSPGSGEAAARIQSELKCSGGK